MQILPSLFTFNDYKKVVQILSSKPNNNDVSGKTLITRVLTDRGTYRRTFFVQVIAWGLDAPGREV